MIYIISKDTFGNRNIHDIQSNSCWSGCPLEGYAIIPDAMVDDILATKGCCDIVLNEDGTEVVSFTAREAPSVVVPSVSFAPGGFGLGANSLPVVSYGDLDDLFGTGWSYLNAPGTTLNGVIFNYAYVFTGYHGVNRYQELRPVSARCGTLYRECYNGTWGNWACDNPPMYPGVEYRTMERSEGDPVYVKRISYTITETIGDINGITDTSILHNISNFGRAVRCNAQKGEYLFPYANTTGGTTGVSHILANAIVVRHYKSVSGPGTFYFDLYYTKTA